MTVIERCAVNVHLVSAIRIAQSIHGVRGDGLEDTGLVVSSVLSSAFGSHDALRPWLLARQDGTKARIVGFGNADKLTRALDAAAPSALEPIMGDVQQVDPITIENGRRYRFQVWASPTRRVVDERHDDRGRRVERDAYLLALEQAPKDQPPLREQVYIDWLASRLPGATFPRAPRLDGYKLVKMARPNRGKDAKDWSYRTGPHALFQGILKVTDADVFAKAVQEGIGRQCAYGLGYMWLEAVQ